MSRFYVTTPIYYVNDLPHIGHVYTTVLTDVIARFRRLAGDEVRFLTGTDEHGQKIERAAAAAGIEPIELADRVVRRYEELWPQLGISHDDFIRTTEPRHELSVHEMIARIEEAGDFYVDTHEGWYCVDCETYYTEKELVDGRLCPDHEREVEWQEEENVFFRLAKYEDRLLEWYETGAVRPETRRNEMTSFVSGGLRDLSVSRSTLDWGLSFPGYPGHTVYVWLDALTNYVSALGFGREDDSLYRRFWDDPESVRFHFIGKDILRHHAVYWPAFLMSAGLPLPSTVYAHGFWLRDEKKVSKSVGEAVRPDHLVERFGAEALRYYLVRDMVLGQDASFSDEAFVERYNGDLANGIGNTVSRLVTLSRKAFDGRTPPVAAPHGELAEAGGRARAAYLEGMDGLAPQRAMEALARLVDETNQFLVAHEPWKMLKDEAARPRVAEILAAGLEAVRVAAVGLAPVMPDSSAAILAAIGCPGATTTDELAWGRLPPDALLPEKASLFPRIDKDEYLAEIAGGRSDDEREDEKETETERKDEMISIDDFMKVDLRTATVTAAEDIEKSNNLLKLTVSLAGEETRTLVAGLKGHYEPADLVGLQVVVVANLQPATLMGVESQGMVLAATVNGDPILLHPDREVPDGSRVR